MSESVREAAFKAHAAGICVLPPTQKGLKNPISEWCKAEKKWKWERWQNERSTVEEITAWYAHAWRTGIGFVCGKISNNLECFEIEDEEPHAKFRKLCDVAGIFPLVERIAAGYLSRSAGGGFHYLYRCSEIDGNTELAKYANKEVMIETRGEGGYIIEAPSHGKVHPTGKPYAMLGGGVPTIITITPEERQQLFCVARSMNEYNPTPKPPPAPKSKSSQPLDGDRPGDDFNRRAEWRDILVGWEFVHEEDGVSYWKRPGSAHRWSATTGRNEADNLYVFSTSTEFETEQWYDKFGAFAILNHGGSIKDATAELGRRGYGKQDPNWKSNGKPPVNIEGIMNQTSSTATTTPAKPTNEQQTTATSKLIMRSYRDVKMQPIHWLIPGVLIAGKFILIAGPGGEGKSTIMRRIIADGSNGTASFGLKYDAKPFDSLVCSLEEDDEDTVKPALFAAGANCDRVHKIIGVRRDNAAPDFVEPFSIAHTQDLLEALKQNPNIKLILIDPITGVLGKVNPDKSAEVRNALQPVIDVCMQTGVALVGITHTGKSQDRARAADRVLGSVQFVNMARIVHMVVPSEDDASLKLLACVKANNSDKSVLAFRVAKLDDDELAGVRESDELDHLGPIDKAKLIDGLRVAKWDSAPENIDVEAFMANSKKTAGKALDKCVDWLRSFLADFAYPSKEIDNATIKAGYSITTMNRARTKLKEENAISCKPEGQGKEKQFWWGPGGDWRCWTKREIDQVGEQEEVDQVGEVDEQQNPSQPTSPTQSTFHTPSTLQDLANNGVDPF